MDFGIKVGKKLCVNKCDKCCRGAGLPEELLLDLIVAYVGNEFAM
jgi:hypothetical protein